MLPCIKLPLSGEQWSKLPCIKLSLSGEKHSVLCCLWLPPSWEQWSILPLTKFSILGTLVNSPLYTTFFVWWTVVHMPYLLLVTTINWDSMVEGNVYLVCQIYHTIPFIKSAECNTNDVYNRNSFINFINILTCLLLYFLNRATYDLSKRNPSKVQPHG